MYNGRTAIKYKLEEGGGVFVDVPTKKVKPSQTCPKCLNQQKKELSERVHCCSECSYTQDRDLAAAFVMILWAINSGANGCERPHSWSLKLYFKDQGTQELRLFEATGGKEARETSPCGWEFRNPIKSLQAGWGSS